MTSRRLTSLLIAWFGLLSIAYPAISCAMSAQAGECCPAKQPAPCGECPGAKSAPDFKARAHCAPVTAQVVASLADQHFPKRAHSPDLPGGFVLPASIAPAMPPAPAQRVTPLSASRTRPDESTTYLVTGRLRL